MDLIKKHLYYYIAALISLIIAIQVYQTGFISNFPWLYLGNADAISWINSIWNYRSEINFWEAKTLDIWLYFPILFYKIFLFFGLSPFVIHSLGIFIFLFSGFVSIKGLFNKYNPQKDYTIFLIAIWYLFSTYTIVNFEWSAIFLYLYWGLPGIIYFLLKENYIWYFVFLFSVFFASAVNLPFWIFLLVLWSLSLFILKDTWYKKILLLFILSLFLCILSVAS